MFVRSLFIAFAISVLPLAAHALDEPPRVAKSLIIRKILEKLDGIALVDIYRGTQKEYIRKWFQLLIVGIQGKTQP